MNKQEHMIKKVSGLYSLMAMVVFLGALFVLSQYYMWQVLPALDGVRMYELERSISK